MTDKGIFYIAFGDSFTKEALFSIESLRRYMPDIPVALYTDKEVSNPLVNIIKVIKPKHIRSKVDFISQSPFNKTLYLDSDTVIARDISDMFDVLDRFDVGATHDYARKRENYCNIPEYKKIPYSFSEVNGGIMAFNNSDRVEIFFDLWKKYFYKYRNITSGWDQVSLRISLWESQVGIHHYPPEYNVRPESIREKVRRNHKKLGESHLKPRIYHMHYDSEVHSGNFNIKTLSELENIVKNKAIKI